MNSTAIRASVALLGTAAVFGTGALALGANASTQAPAPAPATTATAAATGGPAADQAAQGRADVTYLTECVDDHKVSKPATFTLACGDGNQMLEKLVWNTWGHDKATATGVVRENVSEPMSKGDRWITYPVTVTATNLVDGEASATYNTLIVKATNAAPKGVERTQTFELPGNTPATGDSGRGGEKIDHTHGWSDGHEGMSEDPIQHGKGWSDGHEGMSNDAR